MKILFKNQVIFDEFNYQTWFPGNDLVENLCTYVPFLTFESEKNDENQSKAKNLKVSTTPYMQHENSSSFNVPPLKKKCSGKLIKNIIKRISLH